MDPFHLCRGDGQLFPYILPCDGLHRRATIRTEPAFFPDWASDLPDWQVLVQLLPFRFGLPLAGMAFDRNPALFLLPFFPRLLSPGLFAG